MPAKSERDVADLYPPSSRDDLDLARGRALSQYAHLESQLSSLFSQGFETHAPGLVHHNRAVHAVFVFYKIVNTRSRNQILQKVVEDRLKSSSSTFRKTLFKQMAETDEFRNKLAHWTVNGALGTDGQQRHFLVRGPYGIVKDHLGTTDLDSWVIRMRFLFYLFSFVTSKIIGLHPEWAQPRAAFEEILLRPIIYPPLPDHPIVPIWQGPTAPPPP